MKRYIRWCLWTVWAVAVLASVAALVESYDFEILYGMNRQTRSAILRARQGVFWLRIYECKPGDAPSLFLCPNHLEFDALNDPGWDAAQYLGPVDKKWSNGFGFEYSRTVPWPMFPVVVHTIAVPDWPIPVALLVFGVWRMLPHNKAKGFSPLPLRAGEDKSSSDQPGQRATPERCPECGHVTEISRRFVKT